MLAIAFDGGQPHHIAVAAGATTLVTVSLPTSLAVERAVAAGLSLWVLARDDAVTLVNDASA